MPSHHPSMKSCLMRIFLPYQGFVGTNYKPVSAGMEISILSVRIQYREKISPTRIARRRSRELKEPTGSEDVRIRQHKDRKIAPPGFEPGSRGNFTFRSDRFGEPNAPKPRMIGHYTMGLCGEEDDEPLK